MVSAEDHRGTAAHSGAEVLEIDPPGAIGGIYGDIRATLRVPFVDLFFRTLATRPDYLQLAWRQLHTNAQTVYFERAADALRATAVESVRTLGTAPDVPSDDVLQVLRVFHYVDAKLLLSVAALRAATTGQHPRLSDITDEEKRQVPSGVPDDAAAVSLIDPTQAEAEVATVFDRVRSSLPGHIVPDDFRALACWPDYLSTAWNAVSELSTHDGFRSVGRELRLMAEEAILLLPFRMDLSPHVLRHAGLGESDIDFVRSTLDRFAAAMPITVAGTALLASPTLGAGSPFPPHPAPTA